MSRKHEGPRGPKGASPFFSYQKSRSRLFGESARKKRVRDAIQRDRNREKERE
jgi:hypothetical protein